MIKLKSASLLNEDCQWFVLDDEEPPMKQVLAKFKSKEHAELFQETLAAKQGTHAVDPWGNVMTPEWKEAVRHNRTLTLINELHDILTGEFSDSNKLIQAQQGNCRLSEALKARDARIAELELQLASSTNWTEPMQYYHPDQSKLGKEDAQ